MLPFLLLSVIALAPDDSAITVTNTRLTDAEIATGARDYVGAVLPAPAYGQYARWADPVCVKVTGLDDTYAARVAARIDAAAAKAEIRRGKPGCRANLSVVFSEDAATTAAVIVRKKPKQVARLSAPDRERLLTAPLPVRFWHGLELRGADGRAAAPNASAALMSAQSGGGVPLANVLPPNVAETDSRSSSLIDTNIAVWATSGVVIVDVGLATGKSLDAVADYVALVGLAPMKLPPPAPGVPSVLALFSGNASPLLSNWDNAFLTALYKMPMNRSGMRQRGRLMTGIKAELTR
ncbi:MAG: hypothetical protein DCF31_13390 [Alphaproteobacteria bacterium]|nr:MAG: hypothetical protein DCF31_13390 [Alphaproteobacteria bacterium]